MICFSSKKTFLALFFFSVRYFGYFAKGGGPRGGGGSTKDVHKRGGGRFRYAVIIFGRILSEKGGGSVCNYGQNVK